jgi:hypothetical protein
LEGAKSGFYRLSATENLLNAPAIVILLEYSKITHWNENHWDQRNLEVRFKVATAGIMKIIVFWDVTLCSLQVIINVSEESTAIFKVKC